MTHHHFPVHDHGWSWTGSPVLRILFVSSIVEIKRRERIGGEHRGNKTPWKNRRRGELLDRWMSCMTMVENRVLRTDVMHDHAEKSWSSLWSWNWSCHSHVSSCFLSCFETHRRKKKHEFRGKVRKSRNYFNGMPRASLENFDFPSPPEKSRSGPKFKHLS